MRKYMVKLCSILLVCTLMLSCVPMSVFAKVDTKISENKTEYYGRTGDLGIGVKNDDVFVIETPQDYYSVLTHNVIADKDIAMTGVSPLPTVVDNSTSKYFPPIGDQGGLGACVVFACVYYQFTYTINKERDVATTKDNTFSVKWAYNLVNHGNDVGSSQYNLYQVLNQVGCPTAKTLPYDGKDYLSWSTDEKVWREAMRYRLKDSQSFVDLGKDDKQITSPDDTDLIAIKTALNNGDVLKFSSYIYSWEYDNVKTNPLVTESNKYAGEEYVKVVSGYEGGHGMTIVGYNDNLWCDLNDNNNVDAGEMGAFKIANSWGEGYGNKGFMWIPYDTMNAVSTVQGVDPEKPHIPSISDVHRIDVYKPIEGNDIYAKVTVNTADRSQFGLRFYGVKNGTEKSRYFLSGANYSLGSNKYAFDGTNVACDATFVYPLNDLFPDLSADNFEDIDFSIELSDTKKDSVPFTVKSISIVNEHTRKEYKANANYPIVVDGDKVKVDIKDTTRKNAVIYYIGYDEPDLYYKVGNSTFTKVKMQENAEHHGALYKYVIEDVNDDAVFLYFSDANGNIDDNKGQYYSAQVGLNYYYTKGVCEPLVINNIDFSNGTPDISKHCKFAIDTAGGYAPYKYSYVIENLTTGEVREYGYDYNYEVSPYIFSTEGTYRFTITAMDYAKETTTLSKVVEVVNHPFEIASLTTSMSPAIVSKNISFTSVTAFEGIASWGGYKAQSRFVIKDKDGNVCADEIVKYSTYSTQIKTTTTIFDYIPQKAGEYTLTVSSTDCNKEYAEKTISFTVSDMIVGDSDGNGFINVMDATKVQMHIASLDAGKDIFVDMADSDMNAEIAILDATYIQMYVASLSDIAKVGTIIEYIPPVEPPTEEPTPQPTPEPTKPVVKNTVTFTNSFNWGGTIYCYYWSDSDTQMTSWPGKAMTNAGKNDFNETLYTFELPSGVTHIIFSNGSTQTTDISYSGGEVRYYPLSTTDSKGHNLVETW